MTSLLSSALSRRTALSLVALCIVFAGPVAAADGDNKSKDGQDSFKAETVTVKKTIDDGPLVLVNQSIVDGPSRVHVYTQDGLEYQGQLSLGLYSQFIVNHDHSKVYTLSHYLKRYVYGPDDAVVQVFDLNKLKRLDEVSVPNKAALAHGTAHMVEISADDKYVYVQNATPGTSVTVVDAKNLKVAKEIPNPGCWSIYPSPRVINS